MGVSYAAPFLHSVLQYVHISITFLCFLKQCLSHTRTGIQNQSTHMWIAASVFQHSILAVAKAMSLLLFSLWRADVNFCLPAGVSFTEQDSIIEITSYRQHSPWLVFCITVKSSLHAHWRVRHDGLLPTENELSPHFWSLRRASLSLLKLLILQSPYAGPVLQMPQ
jgi:hypothetical protein